MAGNPNFATTILYCNNNRPINNGALIVIFPADSRTTTERHCAKHGHIVFAGDYHKNLVALLYFPTRNHLVPTETAPLLTVSRNRTRINLVLSTPSSATVAKADGGA